MTESSTESGRESVSLLEPTLFFGLGHRGSQIVHRVFEFLGQRPAAIRERSLGLTFSEAAQTTWSDGPPFLLPPSSDRVRATVFDFKTDGAAERLASEARQAATKAAIDLQRLSAKDMEVGSVVEVIEGYGFRHRILVFASIGEGAVQGHLGSLLLGISRLGEQIDNARLQIILSLDRGDVDTRDEEDSPAEFLLEAGPEGEYCAAASFSHPLSLERLVLAHPQEARHGMVLESTQELVDSVASWGAMLHLASRDDELLMERFFSGGPVTVNDPDCASFGVRHCYVPIEEVISKATMRRAKIELTGQLAELQEDENSIIGKESSDLSSMFLLDVRDDGSPEASGARFRQAVKLNDLIEKIRVRTSPESLEDLPSGEWVARVESIRAFAEQSYLRLAMESASGTAEQLQAKAAGEFQRWCGAMLKRHRGCILGLAASERVKGIVESNMAFVRSTGQPPSLGHWEAGVQELSSAIRTIPTSFSLALRALVHVIWSSFVLVGLLRWATGSSPLGLAAGVLLSVGIWVGWAALFRNAKVTKARRLLGELLGSIQNLVRDRLIHFVEAELWTKHLAFIANKLDESDAEHPLSSLLGAREALSELNRSFDEGTRKWLAQVRKRSESRRVICIRILPEDQGESWIQAALHSSPPLPDEVRAWVESGALEELDERPLVSGISKVLVEIRGHLNSLRKHGLSDVLEPGSKEFHKIVAKLLHGPENLIRFRKEIVPGEDQLVSWETCLFVPRGWNTALPDSISSTGLRNTPDEHGAFSFLNVQGIPLAATSFLRGCPWAEEDRP